MSSANRTRRAVHWRHAAALLLPVAVWAGCATRADLLKVQQDQREVRALLADQQVALEGLRRRIEILKTELSEGGRGRGAAPSSQVVQRLADLEARLAALEQGRTPPPAVGPVAEQPAEAPPAGAARAPAEVPPTPAPTPKVLSPQEIAINKEEAALQGQRVDAEYRDALQLIRQARCNEAAPKLRDFIRRSPKSDLADNAQYWIGACYYAQRDFNQAIKELSDVMLKYSKAAGFCTPAGATEIACSTNADCPGGKMCQASKLRNDKVPPALLMLADAFADSGDQIDARLVLKKLVSEHPKSEEAERAKQKLQSLGE